MNRVVAVPEVLGLWLSATSELHLLQSLCLVEWMSDLNQKPSSRKSKGSWIDSKLASSSQMLWKEIG